MESIEYIKAQLVIRASRRQLPMVAEQSGIPLRTLRNIMEGKGTRLSTATTLMTYLKANSRRNVPVKVEAAA